LKQALARHWRSFIRAAIALDVAIVATAWLTRDFTYAALIFPLRWLVMMLGAFAAYWSLRAGALTASTFRLVYAYLVFGFTAAALLGGELSRLPS